MELVTINFEQQLTNNWLYNNISKYRNSFTFFAVYRNWWIPVVEEIVITKKDGTTSGGGGGTVATQGDKQVSVLLHRV